MKNHLRNLYKKKRNKIPSRLHKKFSKKICKNLLFLLGGEPRHILLYFPFQKEVDLMFLRELAPYHHFYLPRILNKKEMEAVPFKDNSDLLPGVLKIPAPKKEIPAFPKEKLDLVLTPGLCFDESGSRIGYGAGYYDRFLKGISAARVGVCFEVQIHSHLLPKTKEDVSLNYLVTENSILYYPEEETDLQ